MAYRRPGITVTQEFVGLVPALAAATLPCVAVGPAYQIVNDDALGSYTGSQTAYAYASLLGGAVVDLAEIAADDPYPAISKEIEVSLENTKVEVLAQQTTGAVDGTAFSDQTASIFDPILAGDLIYFEAATGVSIVAAQTDGVTNTSNVDRLQAGTAGQFADVKAGDVVAVTGGANTNTGSFNVLVKIDDDNIQVDAAINDGGGASTDVAYSITGDRGTANAAASPFRIKTVTDANNIVLESPAAETPEAPLTYTIQREVGTVAVPRVPSLPGDGFTADASAITLPGSLMVVINTITYEVKSADVVGSYRALRNDMAADVVEYEQLSDVSDAFGGSDQIIPANPLAYALQIMQQNTVTSVNGLGLDENAVTNESLSYTNATDVLELTEMYAIAVLSQSTAVHTLFKNHVEQLSLPENKKERVAIINSRLITVSVLQAESTTVTTLTGSRTIVNTQLDGTGNIATPNNLNDATTDQFANVAVGDTVSILGGTNVILGDFTVDTKTDNNNLLLSGNIISSGTPTDIQYVIRRQDGLDADGVTFYDRNATFISNGVSPGNFICIPSGAYAGRHAIATVDSELQVTLATAVAGVTGLVTAVTYQADRDFTKSEQASNLEGFAQALGSRRVAHIWPDEVDAPVGQDIETVPGYFAGCAIAGLTSGLPPQQGFTNLSIGGFLGLSRSNKYFSDPQLNTIANGGNMILIQEGPSQPLVVRHQLTTDRSAIKFQEYSITKNVDFIAKFTRDSYKQGRFIGESNIVDSTLDDLKTTSQAIIKFLAEDTKLPRIGGSIRSGQLTQLAEDELQIDTVKIRFSFNIPIPLNNIDVTIEV